MEKMEFWLIQRGKIQSLDSEIKGLTGRNGLVDLDYMGSAEFEFGAIPRAYRRIMGNFGRYQLIKTSHTNKNGVPMWVFAPSNTMGDIQNALSEYLDNPYHLKECSGLEPFCRNSDTSYGKANFWWEIENGIDFMFFYGAQDRASKFMEVITMDYNDWWMVKDEATRKEELYMALTR